MKYIFDHLVLYDLDPMHLIPLAALVIVALIFWRNISKMKKEEKHLEEQLSAIHAEKAVEQSDLSFMDDLFEPDVKPENAKT